MNRYLSKEDIQMASEHMKRYSTSYIIREWGIKTTRYHCIPIRMANIQNTDNTKCWQGCGATGFSFIPGASAKWYGHSEDSLEISYKSKHTLTVWCSNHTPWYSPKWIENLCFYKNLHLDIYSSFIQNCQSLEATKMSFSRPMDKSTVLHPDNGILFSAEKKWAVKPWKDMEKTAHYQVKKALMKRPYTIWF